MYADHSFCYIMKVTDIFKISNLTERYIPGEMCCMQIL